MYAHTSVAKHSHAMATSLRAVTSEISDIAKSPLSTMSAKRMAISMESAGCPQFVGVAGRTPQGQQRQEASHATSEPSRGAVVVLGVGATSSRGCAAARRQGTKPLVRP